MSGITDVQTSLVNGFLCYITIDKTIHHIYFITAKRLHFYRPVLFPVVKFDFISAFVVIFMNRRGILIIW